MMTTRLRKCGEYYHNIKNMMVHYNNLLTDPEPKLLILTYHRILPEIKHNPLKTIVSLKAFTKQVDVIANKYPVISLNEAVSQIHEGRIKDKIQVVFTFDDGYRDNYETLFPFLRQKGLPAAFSITTGYVGSDLPLWDWEMIMRLSSDENIDEVRADTYSLKRRSGEAQLSFAFRLFEAMRYSDGRISRLVMDFLRERTSGYDFGGDGLMSWAQIKEMSDAGMDIGAHGVSHRSLGAMPLGEASDEILNSKLLIEANTRRDCYFFAFPFGSKKDYSEALIEKVKEARFKACLLNIHGYNRIKPGAFCFKRIIMKESTDPDFLLG